MAATMFVLTISAMLINHQCTVWLEQQQWPKRLLSGYHDTRVGSDGQLYKLTVSAMLAGKTEGAQKAVMSIHSWMLERQQ